MFCGLHRTHNMSKKTNYEKKYRWHDGEGRQLTAGGIIPYDDEGVWLIGERKGGHLSGVEWTDVGGKYRFEDGDIYQTCAREFSEETYYSSNVTRDVVKSMISESTSHKVYVNGHINKPVYVCFLVHTDTLSSHGVSMSREKFLEGRECILKGNPDVPEHFYSSVDLRYFSFEELGMCANSSHGDMSGNTSPESMKISFRLKRIIQYSFLNGILNDKCDIAASSSKDYKILPRSEN